MAPRPSALTGLEIKSMLDYTTDTDGAQRGTVGRMRPGPSFCCEPDLSLESARSRR